MLTALTACSHSGEDEPRPDDTAVLSLRIRLNRPDAGASRATGDEYEADKKAAGDAERMHTLRIIIAGADGKAEHNTLWDLSANPDVEFVGQDYPVKANEQKTIILVANEAGVTLTKADGTKIDATSYLRSIDASIGSAVDMDELRQLTMQADDNSDGKGCLKTPTAMTAIHYYYVAGAKRNYKATFYIHRAAVKYSFRFTNSDSKKTRTVGSVSVNNFASGQYFFPDFDFTDATQLFWNSYNTPAGVTVAEKTLESGITLAPGETRELASVYVPEGGAAATDNPYKIAFTVDDRNSGWLPLNWSMPQTPETTQLMTDLPRNTHVIVNVTLTPETPMSFTIDYTICPWTELEINIPDFN